MALSPLAGKPAPKEMLISPASLEREYYSREPDAAEPAQQITFGTNGHRGSPLTGSFNEAHILAIAQASSVLSRPPMPPSARGCLPSFAGHVWTSRHLLRSCRRRGLHRSSPHGTSCSVSLTPRAHHSRKRAEPRIRMAERTDAMTTPIPPLTQRPAWAALQVRQKEVAPMHLRKLFADDPKRGERLTLQAAGKRAREIDAETTPLRDPEYYQYDFNLTDVAEVWRRGSVIASWLLDLTAAALLEDPSLSKFAGRVSDSGEGRWTIKADIDEGVPTPVLTTALYERFSSRGNVEFQDKLLSAMRYEFGGHVEKSAK
jgi:hypothetical protein